MRAECLAGRPRLAAFSLGVTSMRAFLFRVELLGLVRRLIACIMPMRANTKGPPFSAASVDAMRGGLNFFHPMPGFWDLFCQPRDSILERDELSAAGQFDRFVETCPILALQAPGLLT
jgi:hypothetical protein